MRGQQDENEDLEKQKCPNICNYLNILRIFLRSEFKEINML